MAKGTKLSVRLALDVLMMLALVLLYKAKVLTLMYHEVMGIGILLVFLLHCIFNRGWIAANTKKLFDPKLLARTKFSYWISVALVLSFLIIVISGVFISKILFRGMFDGMDMSIFRTLHYFFSAVSLILVGIHLGIYWPMVKGFVRKHCKISEKATKPLCYLALILVVAFGVYSIPTSNFGSWLMCPVVPIEHHGHGDKGERAAEGQQVPEGEQAAKGERAGEGEAPEGEAAQQGEREQSDRPERGEAAGEGSQAADGERGKGGRGGNHGNNVELPNILLTIAQFSCIVGLFAAITYYLDGALRKRKHTQASKEEVLSEK